YTDVGSAFSGGAERRGKTAAERPAVEDVDAEVHILACALDRADHRIEYRACLMQQIDAISGGQRPAAQSESEPRKRQQCRWRRAAVLRRAIDFRMPGEQLASARFDAVDAEQVVKKRACKRQREAHGDPTERRLRAAFVQQRMQGSRGSG